VGTKILVFEKKFFYKKSNY